MKTIAERLADCEYKTSTLNLYQGRKDVYMPLVRWNDGSISKVETVTNGMETKKFLKFHDVGIKNRNN
jgi:hypothetical protein